MHCSATYLPSVTQSAVILNWAIQSSLFFCVCIQVMCACLFGEEGVEGGGGGEKHAQAYTAAWVCSRVIDYSDQSSITITQGATLQHIDHFLYIQDALVRYVRERCRAENRQTTRRSNGTGGFFFFFFAPRRKSAFSDSDWSPWLQYNASAAPKRGGVGVGGWGKPFPCAHITHISIY